MEGKYGTGSGDLEFNMILSQIRRSKLLDLISKFKIGDTPNVVQDDITTPFSKIVRKILPNADFDWRKDKLINN